MIGETDKEPILAKGARYADCMICVGGYVIEGTSIIAREKETELLKKGYTPEFINKAKNYLHEPGISVVNHALYLSKNYKINAMHDATEGGIANGAVEIAEASGLGLRLYERNLQEILLTESERLCKEYKLNPLGTITSGSLLLTTDQETAVKLVQDLRSKNVTCAVIGILTREKTYTISRKNDTIPLQHSAKDEITKIFE